MKQTIFTLLAVCLSTFCQAQQVATFENLPLSKPDTFWNGQANGSSLSGFTDGNLYFVNNYDTSFGGYWGGCSYSNVVDTLTNAYSNQYACIAGKGYNGSSKYGIAYADFNADNNKIKIVNPTVSNFVYGTYVSNSTLGYLTMKNGDFISKKMGGATGNDPDYFGVQFTGWRNGIALTDTVTFYLADFRDSNNANDYIVKDWRWVNLQKLGKVDSLSFNFIGSDTGAFGINTPLYFCFDNFTTGSAPLAINNIEKSTHIIYPNPATEFIVISNCNSAILVNNIGQKMNQINNVIGNDLHISLQNLPQGLYFIKTENGTYNFLKN
jgi:hypothetical protein